MIWIIIISLYCGAAWAFSIALFGFIPGERTFAEVMILVFAPIMLPVSLIYELFSK